MTIAQKIDKMRVEQGFSKDALEKKAGLSAGRICKWLSGQGSPSVDHIMRISDAMGVSPLELMEDVPMIKKAIASGKVPPDDQRKILEFAAKLGTKETMKRLVGPSLPTRRGQHARRKASR